MSSQVNWLRTTPHQSTRLCHSPIISALEFGYRTHLTKDHQAHKQLIYQAIHTLQSIHSSQICTKICHIQAKSRPNPRGLERPQQSHHFSVAGFSLPLGLLTKPKVNIQFESPPHFYLSKGKAKKRTKAK